MAALATGSMAPDFTLPRMNGGTFSLRDALKRGPVVLAFFKISCPVCQLAFPYLQRLYEACEGKNVTIIGVSQNDQKDAASFAKEFGLKFPIALDDPKNYQVSNAYGLTNVPTIFFVTQDHAVEQSIVGWSRDDMEQLGRNIASASELDSVAVFNPGESVPEFKAG